VNEQPEPQDATVTRDPIAYVVEALRLVPDDPADATLDDLELLRLIWTALQNRGAELLAEQLTAQVIADRALVARALAHLTTYAERAVAAHGLTLDRLALGEFTTTT
jgi:myo-inositol catabolism protein IolC